jgi:putative ABC transport system ATP-binding protein
MISIENVSKVYQMGETEVRALDDVSLRIEKGEMTAIMGQSGSGKSTLLSILGCLDVPTSGGYSLDGVNVEKMSDDELAAVRNQKIGFVFQQFNLLARTSALENVALPLVYRGLNARDRRKRAEEALDRVGLRDRMHHRPNELSWRLPAPWQTTRPFYWPMNPPAHSIARPALRSFVCFSNCTTTLGKRLFT